MSEREEEREEERGREREKERDGDGARGLPAIPGLQGDQDHRFNPKPSSDTKPWTLKQSETLDPKSRNIGSTRNPNPKT